MLKKLKKEKIDKTNLIEITIIPLNNLLLVRTITVYYYYYYYY